MIEKPMKAPSESAKLEELKFPLLASYKLDGLRALHLGDTVHSKTLKLFPNKHTSRLFADRALAGLDGEIIVGVPYGKGVINRTSSGVMSIKGEPNVILYVFDDFTHVALPYHLRLSRAMERVKKYGAPHVAFLRHKRIRNVAELLAMEEFALKRGYEGLMLRSEHGPYKEGTCTQRDGWLRKFKRFEDSEAVITAVLEGAHNTNVGRTTHKAGMVAAATVGTLIGTDVKTGAEVRIAPGRLTQHERAHYWKFQKEVIGKTCTYRHFPTEGFAAPRFPTFQCWRDPSNM